MDNFVLCSRDSASNRLVYYTGTESAYGGSYYGNVLEAKRFSSIQDAAAEITKHPGEFYLGVNIINISDTTFAVLADSKIGDSTLYHKFHDPNYAIR